MRPNPSSQENRAVATEIRKNYNEDGTYTTAAALSLPVGTPALVLCSDGTWRLALRAIGGWPYVSEDLWRFADGKSRRVQGSSAAPVAMFDPRDKGVLAEIGHLIYSNATSPISQIVDHLIFALVPEVHLVLEEPGLIGSVVKDADGVFWTRITPGDADGIWLASDGARREKWKGVRAVELLSSGYDPDAPANGEAAA